MEEPDENGLHNKEGCRRIRVVRCYNAAYLLGNVMKMFKKLPIGTQSFETLRKFNEIYIDKTELIYQLASSRGKVFLARPRRFGKSLLVSTFASLFAHGLRDFKGLAIEKLWKDNEYNVIQLDFSTVANFNSVERFDEGFKAMLAVRFGDLGFRPSGDDVRFMAEFSNWLSKQDGGSLVLLIDEYDSPLTQVLNDEKLFLGIQGILKEFFNILKFNEGVFRFLFPKISDFRAVERSREPLKSLRH